MKTQLSILLITVVLLSSCSKNLDKQPLDAASSTTYWQTQTDAVQAVNNCYRYLVNIDNDIFLSCATDDSYAWSGWPLDIAGAGNGSATASQGTFNTYWTQGFNAIAACNNVLDNIDNVPSASLTDALRAQYKGEARFIRAYYYQQLAGYFGDVPLITHIQTPSEFDVTRSPADSVYNFIVGELTAIAPDLPTSYDAADQGRVTQGAALAHGCDRDECDRDGAGRAVHDRALSAGSLARRPASEAADASGRRQDARGSGGSIGAICCRDAEPGRWAGFHSDRRRSDQEARGPTMIPGYESRERL